METTDSLFNEIVLEKLAIGVSRIISKELIDGYAKFSWGDFGESIRCDVRGYVLTEKVEDVIVRYPRNWFEAFKKEHFPDWALEMWPVDEVCHIVGWHVMYPDFKPSLPPEHSRMIVHTHSGTYPTVER